MESLPSVVFETHAVAAAAVSFVRMTSQVEGKKGLGADAEWETSASGRLRVTTIQVAPLHGTYFLFRLQRVPSGLTKETFPTSLDGLLADANTLEVCLYHCSYSPCLGDR
ncbi:unnamed protein product [Laminaria digitata]